jgi:hypothetical protein
MLVVYRVKMISEDGRARSTYCAAKSHTLARLNGDPDHRPELLEIRKQYCDFLDKQTH